MGAIAQGMLRVECEIPIEDISRFHLQLTKSQHAVVELVGMIREEIGTSLIWRKLEGSPISVFEADEKGNKKNPILFSGMLKKVEIKHEGSGYEVTITAVSQTERLDYEKKSRSFQDIHMTYKEIVQMILADTKDTNVIFRAKDRKIEKPIYQYKETDWEFLLRIASHLSTSLMPVITSNHVEFVFGLPNGKLFETDAFDIRKENVWFDKAYDKWKSVGRTYRKEQFICLEVTAYDNMNVGDNIEWESKTYMIVSKSCQLVKGLVRFRYILADKLVYETSRFGNPKLIGAILAGTVLETRDETLKVKLDIDVRQDKERAFWYVWLPDAGNILYCMPEKEERIYIQIADEEGKQVRGICSIRSNGAGNSEMNTKDRYLTTAENKQMYLTPASIGFIDKKQTVPLKVEIDDKAGANFESNKKLVITAQDKIGIKGNRISIQAPQEISLLRRGLPNLYYFMQRKL